jgi:Xaa-Pro aminopeptidase
MLIIKMRTTVIIDDAILREAKRAAAKAGCTLSDLVNQALSAVLARRSEPRPDFHMIVYGGSSAVSHEPEDLKNAIESEDAESLEH